jgi:DNA-binding MarR family transcriptional regulator
MTASAGAAEPDPLLRILSEFRFELRRFLAFSEAAALEAGMHPKQHQLLLQVAGAADPNSVTITYAAERLGLKHNSAVELVNRSEREGLLERRPDANDRRRAILRLTRKGRRLLRGLSEDHARELNEMAPRLIGALERIRSQVPAFVPLREMSEDDR